MSKTKDATSTSSAPPDSTTAPTDSSAPPAEATPPAEAPVEAPLKFLADTGDEIEAHADFQNDLKQGIKLATLRDTHGRPYSHCREDAEGRWVYRQGHS